MAGMPRKSAAIRRAEGNRGHRPIPNEVKAATGKPQMPENLNELEQLFWHELVRTVPKAVLTASDLQCMERMSRAWAAYRTLSIQINNSKPLITGASGTPVLNPLWRARALAAHEMDRCGGQLGLSPVSRTKLTEPDNAEDDPLDQLLAMAANAG